MVRQRFSVPTRCILQFTRGLRTHPIYENHPQHEQRSHQVPSLGLATPRQLVQYLDQFIVGQQNAKKVLSVAVFNHYNRVKANQLLTEAREESETIEARRVDPDSGVEPAKIRPFRYPATTASSLLSPHTTLFEKSNVLVIGPTGKTLLAKTLAKVLDVPFSVSDATSFTQAGYVGEDVEMAIQRLLQDANWDPVRASMGIVYIDEIDKLARKSGSGMEGSRDVSGEGVQQALLRMMEGSVISIQAKAGAAEPVPPRDGGHSRGAKPDTHHIDTSNILFIVSGAFVGLDNIIRQRVSKAAIGFSASSSESFPFFTPNRKATHNMLELVQTTDLVKYGFIPEFISRLPTVTTLSPLTIPDLRRVLTEVKGSLVSQYQALFGYSGVEIRFTSAALDEICRKAAEKDVGARGLRGIMESLLLEPMYEVPGSDVRFVLITKDVVSGGAPPGYWKKGDGAAVSFWEAWAKEEGNYDREKNRNS
ncbi:ClpX, ATPase regulatory subunit [Dendrothele bispora CBS 962.96]|uniref:ClpX, ATPase regulatory subunit n=1 Tax=Dendrothele bispora (strain CBS 962.96) TaxID=1314807 RepID=A0A4S8MQX0_DENBC|nr:ClpX, ATPase regulatory subunit [Dendrothele bispora CBS 962.96]